MFSSWPSSALVDGVNIGSSSLSLSWSPAGMAFCPWMVPVVLYSFQAEPDT